MKIMHRKRNIKEYYRMKIDNKSIPNTKLGIRPLRIDGMQVLRRKSQQINRYYNL